jgi:hypothetical protein
LAEGQAGCGHRLTQVREARLQEMPGLCDGWQEQHIDGGIAAEGDMD